MTRVPWARGARGPGSATARPLLAVCVALAALLAPLATLGEGADAGLRDRSRLDEIVAGGVLRVGTTGDYAPFSLREGDGTYVGFDIAMAQALAASLDAQLQLVPTTWSTLMDDLLADRFHIAMSGVSRTLRRARSAAFSRPYYSGGKTVISRCSDADRFDDLEAVDQPSTRAVVNPGGTNERVTRALLQRASIRVHSDNRTVFQEIAAHRADVMITDAIEVAVQTRRDPTLCAALSGTLLQPVDKAYLLPRDEAWIRYVDLWLEGIPDARRAEMLASQVEDAAAR